MSQIVENDSREATLRAANVSPKTGLATDYLNLFNEYLMLAELVEAGSMTADVLDDWLPVDYETHFAQSGFAGAPVTIAAYRAIPKPEKQLFDSAVGQLIDLIVSHQDECTDRTSGQTQHRPCVSLLEISKQRDVVSALISGTALKEPDTQSAQSAQSAIDALFD